MDTIAAISTAMSSSGVSIVRISGDAAFTIIDKIYRRKGNRTGDLSKAASHTIHYGYIVDGDEIIDEVLVMVMRNPRSYTAEDTIEIDCHGGILNTKKILETVLKYGARPAEPGEFTKRAFLNGRIDLAQAEAVIGIINSKNDYALRASIDQLDGSVSRAVREVRNRIIYHIAFIESALDDPEHISLDGYVDLLLNDLRKMREALKKLIRSSDNGKVMTEGIKTVIFGKTNVGKSSLMNILVRRDRAIVTDVAGTTRDVLEETTCLENITLHLIDTAGIRDTEDIVEKIGVERARSVADDADLILCVLDSSCLLDDSDEKILDFIQNRKAIVLLNKSDLAMKVTVGMLEEKTMHRVIAISVKERMGIEKLEEEIKNMFYQGEINFNDEVVVTNVRHRNALVQAYKSLKLVGQSIESGMPEDFYSIDLMDAYEQLGLIIGEAVGEDLVNEIFSKFCVGK